MYAKVAQHAMWRVTAMPAERSSRSLGSGANEVEGVKLANASIATKGDCLRYRIPHPFVCLVISHTHINTTQCTLALAISSA